MSKEFDDVFDVDGNDVKIVERTEYVYRNKAYQTMKDVALAKVENVFRSRYDGEKFGKTLEIYYTARHAAEDAVKHIDELREALLFYEKVISDEKK